MPRDGRFSISVPFEPTGDRPLPDELFEFLRAAIRRGDLLPGQRLVEDAIAQATSVSRTPVREALRKLANAGLASSEGRGLVVARLSSNDVQELWEVMEGLEVTAARLAAEQRSEADIAEMTYLIRSGNEDDLSETEVVQLNQSFRNSMLRASGNRILTDLLTTLITQIESLVSLTEARVRADVPNEHQAVLDAIKRRDPDAAQQAIQKHLRLVLAETLIQMRADAGSAATRR